jgi:DNA-directed RNA polymerase alpha subunit
MSEFWDIPVQEVTILENDPKHHHVEEFRLKLMEIADKVEAGVYTTATVSLVAADNMFQKITTGQIDVFQRADGVRGSGWTEVTATIPDKEKFIETYEAFMEDTLMLYESDINPDKQHRDTCIVALGNNRSEGDTTRYVEE